MVVRPKGSNHVEAEDIGLVALFRGRCVRISHQNLVREMEKAEEKAG